MILVADTKAMNSLLHPTPDVEPWIWAVDVNFGWKIGDQLPQDLLPDHRYPGYIRVALSVVLSEFWPLLMVAGHGPLLTASVGRQLWTPDLGLWEGIGI
jgi:hypothetical protein